VSRCSVSLNVFAGTDRRRQVGDSGAAVGAVTAVSGAGAVRVRRGGVRAGARRVGLLRANGSACGRAAAADGRGGIRAAVRIGPAAPCALPRAGYGRRVRLGAGAVAAGVPRAAGRDERRRATARAAHPRAAFASRRDAGCRRRRRTPLATESARGRPRWPAS
jgi:hypothetical protein